jgi:hypothetical protein
MENKHCKNCDKTFTPNSNSQKYCEDCRVRKCAFCGEDFEIKDGHWKRQFCSVSCKAKAQSAGKEPLQFQKNRGKKPRKRTIFTCAVCGRTFEHHTARKAKYCSKECWSKRNPRVLNDCLVCGKEFWSYKHQNQKYCSQKCRQFHLRELKKGEKSHFWTGGKTKKSKLMRTRAEYTDWRNAVFQRDDYTCQRCGIKSGNGFKVYLHAHHIKPMSEYPELRLNIDNGITLCKDCHLLEHNHKF